MTWPLVGFGTRPKVWWSVCCFGGGGGWGEGYHTCAGCWRVAAGIGATCALDLDRLQTQQGSQVQGCRPSRLSLKSLTFWATSWLRRRRQHDALLLPGGGGG